ncbi:MAG: CopG family transcriptional regulator [Marinospirillum sp.]|uniref:ribbon-helix-helix domain-containing protein n=1 Tax=Marinospirillum sp. TaxID=2183934 RepID=UPI001A02F1B9|nr:CopG family transcriptional regulator [Marinospirillum sp.]MBE0508963.1 CopG family transcriptional regulator [Marinospirillum sp.]
MSTTTLRLPDNLKARIAEAAKRNGVTPHHFMLEAVAEKTEQAEHKASFDALAEERYARILETGNTLDWVEVRDYLQARATGQTAVQPKAHGRGKE